MKSMQPIDPNWRNAYRSGYQDALEDALAAHAEGRSLNELEIHAKKLEHWMSKTPAPRLDPKAQD